MSAPTKRQIAVAVLDMTKTMANARVAQKLAAYLVNNHRSSELDAIMREVQLLREKTTGTAEVTLTSANKLNETDVKNLIKIIDVDKSVVNRVIDQEMVGGVRIEASGKLLDLTVRNRLDQLKKGVTV
jgi:ATP synthase F1 delta subunit